MRNWLSILPFVVVIGLVLAVVFTGGGGLVPTEGGLRIGSIAPEVEGTDQDGVAFKLTDYRGKAVMLSFFGEWCRPCRSLYPHERSLVTKYKDRPFVLLGVNTDEARESLRAAVDEKRITWRCFYDGATDGSAGGPISANWRINGFPTMYLIDATGVIRYKHVGAQDMGTVDRYLERIVKEAEGTSG
jgi:peroxiredoxin